MSSPSFIFRSLQKLDDRPDSVDMNNWGFPVDHHVSGSPPMAAPPKASRLARLADITGLSRLHMPTKRKHSKKGKEKSKDASSSSSSPSSNSYKSSINRNFVSIQPEPEMVTRATATPSPPLSASSSYECLAPKPLPTRPTAVRPTPAPTNSRWAPSLKRAPPPPPPSRPAPSSSSSIKRRRIALDLYETAMLNELYSRTQFPSDEDVREMAAKLGFEERVIRAWFESKRRSADIVSFGPPLTKPLEPFLSTPVASSSAMDNDKQPPFPTYTTDQACRECRSAGLSCDGLGPCNHCRLRDDLPFCLYDISAPSSPNMQKSVSEPATFPFPCKECQRRKVKCNQRQPCLQCILRGHGESEICTYAYREAEPSKGGEDYVKRPANAFILFRRDFRRKYGAVGDTAKESGYQHRQRQADLAKTISAQWRSLPPEQRAYWEELAKQLKAEHKKMYPGYVYRPMPSREKSRKSSTSWPREGKGKSSPQSGSESDVVDFAGAEDSDSASFVLPNGYHASIPPPSGEDHPKSDTASHGRLAVSSTILGQVPIPFADGAGPGEARQTRGVVHDDHSSSPNGTSSSISGYHTTDTEEHRLKSTNYPHVETAKNGWKGWLSLEEEDPVGLEMGRRDLFNGIA